MKKHSFYTFMQVNNKAVAVLKEGYSDGTFYYYKSNYCGTWQAIHPLVGLSVAYGYTRKEAAEKAHNAELMQSINRIPLERGQEMTKEFEKAIAAAK